MVSQLVEMPRPEAASQKNGEKIPDSLVRETINGVPFYYPGFRDVLNKTKTIEEIMPDSSFQTGLKNEIGDFLKSKLGKKQYRIWAGEAGLHINRSNNLGLDVVVYDKSVLPKEKIDNHFINVPAELVIEIDLDVEMEEPGENLFFSFVLPKTDRLLEFGTKKVVWIFSKERKIIVATKGGGVKAFSWSDPIELMPGVVLELERLIEEAEL